MNKQLVFRQGDVLLIRVDGIPEEAKPVDHLVLAHGEVTGHKHQIMAAEAAQQFVSERLQFLRVLRPRCKIQHEEHSAIEIPEGDYQIIIQVEYMPAELRQVAD